MAENLLEQLGRNGFVNGAGRDADDVIGSAVFVAVRPRQIVYIKGDHDHLLIIVVG